MSPSPDVVVSVAREYYCTLMTFFFILMILTHSSLLSLSSPQDHESAQESWELREAELERRLEETKKEIKVTSNVPTKKVSRTIHLYLSTVHVDFLYVPPPPPPPHTHTHSVHLATAQ